MILNKPHSTVSCTLYSVQAVSIIKYPYFSFMNTKMLGSCS